ncbi:hypothetical protein NDI56_19455 [Haloarcula sp. S1CR25-12]|uniref:Uncharacterized protein n=1 Tax=Haloarcula saliterrae TaxID=2950534 RepID=A0ABU2FH35_9EURY|nr:hypothetical protein [Haloarcula sp. S1CR25-12]MDS0261582.1 hypothetical protein [Haloarcula sp. S1CR25-12]
MVRWVTVAGLFVVFALVGTGPLTGVDVTSAADTSFGDGDATVTDITVDRSELALTPGRFGANVTYLRVPTATVTVGGVTDRPRLLYVVSVPALDIRLIESRVVTGPGTYRLAPDDRAIPPGTAGGSYDATLSVRVQSFTGDRPLTRATVTVGGQP